VARAARLRAYDAVYAALALERGAVLLTLDREVCSKLDGAFPEALLVTPMWKQTCRLAAP
jgi:predicted nucleic acid-binding protein